MQGIHTSLYTKKILTPVPQENIQSSQNPSPPSHQRTLLSPHTPDTDLSTQTMCTPQGHTVKPRKDKGPVLAIEYHPKIRDLPLALREAHRDTIQRISHSYPPNNPTLTLLRDLPPPTIAWKRRTNLADQFIRAKLPPPN